MKFIKYYTPCNFQNEEFCALLWEKMNVRCKPVDDGVILDLDAFNMVPAGYMPTWAWMNRDDINSKLHTRLATEDEWPELTPKTKYVLGIIFRPYEDEAVPMENADGLEYIKRQADEAKEDFEDDPDFEIAVVIDRDTGKVVYTA